MPKLLPKTISQKDFGGEKPTTDHGIRFNQSIALKNSMSQNMLDNPLRGVGSVSHGLTYMQTPTSKPSTHILTGPMKSA